MSSSLAQGNKLISSLRFPEQTGSMQNGPAEPLKSFKICIRGASQTQLVTRQGKR